LKTILQNDLQKIKKDVMSKPINSFYNSITFFYPLIDLFLKSQKRKLFEELNNMPIGKLLDVGVGNGSQLQFYKPHHITGIDTSLSMLAKA
jgi:phosphatidylethanolamine/phosphatidyl-N-methylethanolamine N-methyltransferase